MAAVIPAAALRPAAASHCVVGTVLFPVHLHKELEQHNGSNGGGGLGEGAGEVEGDHVVIGRLENILKKANRVE